MVGRFQPIGPEGKIRGQVSRHKKITTGEKHGPGRLALGFKKDDGWKSGEEWGKGEAITGGGGGGGLRRIPFGFADGAGTREGGWLPMGG